MKKRKLSFTRLRSMTLDEGMAYIRSNTQDRKINGFWVESISKQSNTRIQMFKAGKISCVSCGLVGDHFHIERHPNDLVMPFSINLYATVGSQEILMTWDHIIPRSLGGSNHLSNAQCMCTNCNSRKGNSLSLSEIISIVERKDLFLMYRVDPQTTDSVFKTIRDVSNESKCDYWPKGKNLKVLHV